MAKVPYVIPIDEFKNAEEMTQKCKESDVPIIITENGENDMIMMSMSTFDKVVAEVQVAALVNESVRDLKSGAELLDGDEVFATLMGKYGK